MAASSTTTTTDKEKTDTLNVEFERDLKKMKGKASTSTRQLYVQVKRKRVKRQYRRNQDAINFLRRFTLAVVIIELILSISESSLISTFFLFLTLSTTFDVKPENVIDTYCHNYHQGDGNSMCELYMEAMTGYTAMNRPHHSSANNPNENHFPTVPIRPPLSPSESRKLFLAFNQSFFDPPVRFNLAQKLDQDSKLSRMYTRLIFLLSGKNIELLTNNTISLYDFLTYANDSDTHNTPDLDSKLLIPLISKQLKQSIEIINPHVARPPPHALKWSKNLIFRFPSKSLDKLRTAQRIKQIRRMKEDNKQSINFPQTESPLANPFRKNLIQATEFVRHRWKRDAYMIPSAPSDPSTKSPAVPFENFQNVHAPQQQTVKKVGLDVPIATGSNVGEEKGTAAHVGVVEPGKEQGNGGRTIYLIKSRNSGNKDNSGSYLETVGQMLGNEDDTFYDDTPKPTISSREAPKPTAAAENNKYCKHDTQQFFMKAETTLSDLMMADKTFAKTKTESLKSGKGKCLTELSLGLDKNPRHILSLIEASLFGNWQHLIELADLVKLHYGIDDSGNGLPKVDKDDTIAWLSVRQKAMESLALNLETNIFSSETFKKAERRKRAMEQIYHDYSFTLLGELRNVKEIPVSRTFQNVYWVIKLYVVVWEAFICMVLFYGSVFEDKTALNIWGLLNILTSLSHFMVDDWINSNFQPEKSTAAIWFGVIYGIYKPITILLVATLSCEIYKKDGTKKNQGVLARIHEIIRGRKRPRLIAYKCLEKLKGLFITPESEAGGDGKNNNEDKKNADDGGENNNGNLVYKGIKAVNIRAKIRRMEMVNGNLIVFTQTVAPGVKVEQPCMICGSLTPGTIALKCKEDDDDNPDKEKTHEGHLFHPSSSLDNNEAGMSVKDMYPEETDDEEEDEDELEEVVDEDEDELEEIVDEDDESDEEKDGDNEKCCHSDHDCNNIRASQRSFGAFSCDKDAIPMDAMPADVVVMSEGRKSGSTTVQSGLSLIAYAGNGIQGNLLNDSNARAPSQGQGEDLLRGPIVDGGNLYI